MNVADLPISILTKSQKKDFYSTLDGKSIKATIRWDDECGNGHNSFSVTGSIGTNGRDGAGCIHDEISKAFPEFSHLIKWHLMGSDCPMHYLSNALYLAGTKDCHGLNKGEVRGHSYYIFFNDVPIPVEKYNEEFGFWLMNHNAAKPITPKTLVSCEWPASSGKWDDLEIQEFNYEGKSLSTFSPNYTFKGYNRYGKESWYGCPFSDRQEAENFLLALKTCKVEFRKYATSWGEGKEPELEAARRSAIWPEAELEDFTEEKLLARLPDLMNRFKADVEALGFVF